MPRHRCSRTTPFPGATRQADRLAKNWESLTPDLYKATGVPWQNGTAIYHPINTVAFGPWPGLSHLVTAWGPMVALTTAVVVIIQVSFAAMLLKRTTRTTALVIITALHVSIAVMIGLTWFSLALLAADSIFIRDVTGRQSPAACASPGGDRSPSAATLRSGRDGSC